MLSNSLRGIRVTDFTQIGAGPTCSMFLGDLGAEVIKVEPRTGDLGRRLGPPWTFEGQSAVFTSFNRNKRSIAIDLKSTDGVLVAKALMARSDVVIESFRPGVMDRLGIGYEVAKALNPGVIYAGVSAYGSKGEGARLGGVDGIIQAESGLMSLLGREGEAPSKVQAPIVDVTTGHIATIAILAKLMDRAKGGPGGFLDVSMLGAAVALQQSSVTGFFGDERVPTRLGSAAPYSAPNEAFEAADGWVMVAAYQDDRWESFCRCLELPQLLTDSRFATSSLRVQHRPQLQVAIAAKFRTQTCAQWVQRLLAEDVLCSKVSDYRDLSANPRFRSLGLLTKIADDLGRECTIPAFPVADVQSPDASCKRAPPRCGQHTDEVLREIGFSSTDVRRLHAVGAVFGDSITHP